MTEDLSEEEIERIREQKLKELAEDQERYYKEQVRKGIIHEYKNGNGKVTKEEEKQDKKEIFSQKYVGKDYLAEAIFVGGQSFFAVSQKVSDFNDFPSIILAQSIPLDEKTVLKPPEEMSYLNKPYSFESKEKFYEYVESMKTQDDLYSLFQQVKSIWKKHVDADNFHISICAADTIFSYLQDKIGLTHYLFYRK